MGLTTAGLNHLLGLGIGEVLTSFINASAYIGVGGGASATTAFAISQTDLQGASKTRKACDSTYPSRSGNVLTARATFATGDANFQWDEFGLFNSSSGGIMLHRGVSSAFFIKNSSTTAVLTTTLTLTAA